MAAGAGVGLLAVAAAAGSAHGGIDPARLRTVAAAAQMLGWHGLALFGCGLWGARGGRLTHVAGSAFVSGLLLFCGAVYLPLFGGPSLGMAAPVGGALLMLGWAVLGISALRR